MIYPPFEYDAVDRKVWEEELAPVLPPRLFDVHSHVWWAAEYRAEGSADPSLPSVVEEYPLEALREGYRTLFPGREVQALVFGSGDRETDYAAQNTRLGNTAPELDCHSLLYARPEWDEKELERQLAAGHLGFKPYWTLAGSDLEEVGLPDMISPAMRRVAEARGLVVMVHIPRVGRLNDPRNIEELRRLCERAPRAKFVLAHLGRSYFPEAMENLRLLADLPNLWADCAMVQDERVIAYALSVFPRERVMFGLDLPIALVKGKLISVNGQRHFLTKHPYPWSVHAEPGAYEVRCTTFAYEIVRALLRGAAGLGRVERDALFWDNAQRLVQSVKERVER